MEGFESRFAGAICIEGAGYQVHSRTCRRHWHHRHNRKRVRPLPMVCSCTAHWMCLWRMYLPYDSPVFVYIRLMLTSRLDGIGKQKNLEDDRRLGSEEIFKSQQGLALCHTLRDVSRSDQQTSDAQSAPAAEGALSVRLICLQKFCFSSYALGTCA